MFWGRSKIRSSIKIALQNLCAHCQWSACSAVDISLPASAGSHFLFASPLSSFPSSWCLSLSLSPSLSKLCLFLHSPESLFFALSPLLCILSFRSSLGQLQSDLPPRCVILIKVSFGIWCCLLRGSTCLYLTTWMVVVILSPGTEIREGQTVACSGRRVSKGGVVDHRG